MPPVPHLPVLFEELDALDGDFDYNQTIIAQAVALFEIDDPDYDWEVSL
jgi:hypothetical protein